MLNYKIAAQVGSNIQFIRSLRDPIEQLGALKLLKRETDSLCGKDFDHLKTQIDQLITENKNLTNVLRKSITDILSAKKSNQHKDFSNYSEDALVSEMLSDFKHLQSFGEVRKKVLDATSRIIEHMSYVKSAKELINHVINEIQSIASSNRLLLYEEGIFDNGERYLDATYAWGSAKYPVLSGLSNLVQKLKLYVARKTRLLPYAIPQNNEKHLSAATKVWADKMDPILIANIPKIELRTLFSFSLNENKKPQNILINQSEDQRTNINVFFEKVDSIAEKNYRDFKDKLKYKIIYQLKDTKQWAFYDKEGRELKLIDDGILVSRGDVFEYLELTFSGPYDIFALDRDEHDWKKKSESHVELNAAVTKVANVETMVLYPMTNLGVLLISDIQLRFAKDGKITAEGKLYLESIRILTDMLNQAILVIKNKELIEKYKEMIYQSHVAKFGKKTADLILQKGQTGDSAYLPFVRENAVMRFIDLRACTQYAEFLKNADHFGLLLNTVHDAFQKDTVDNNGRIIQTEGDGSFNAFETEKDALAATLSSFQKLSKYNQLYNYQIFEDYVQKALDAVNYPESGIGSKEGEDKLKIIKNKFIDKLLNSVIELYGLNISKSTTKKYRLQIYSKIKSVNNKNEVVLASVEFFDLLKVFSQKLYNVKKRITGNQKKIGPLFKFVFKVGVGMNNGTVVWGSVGSKTASIDISMMGDPVNATSRLETANKTYGTGILVSEDFMKALFKGKEIKIGGHFKYKKHHVFYREIDHVVVMGKDEPVRIYELLSN